MQMIIKCVAIILITLINPSCAKQNQKESIIRNKDVYENRQNINYSSGDIVTKGFLDSNGEMWFTTTQEGVFKYDGKTFINYSIEDGLCGNEVWAIIEDEEENIWFGTGKGLCKFNGKKFESIPIPKDSAKSKWLEKSYPIVNPNAVSSLIQDSNGIFWIGTNGAGVYRYDGNEFNSYLKKRGKLMPDSLHHNVVLSIAENGNGDIWFSSFSHGGISQYNENGFVHHSLKDGFGDGMISSLYCDKKDILWVGTRNGGIYCYDATSFSNITESSTGEQIAMATFLEDSKDTIWAASYARKSVYQYDGKSFRPFKIKNSNKLIDIKFISEDKEGNIWFGGRYGLLWRFDGNELKDFTQRKRMK